jgi:hypothetical protein
VTLHWSPSAGATSYTIYRDGTLIDTPTWKGTCFTDNGDLDPNGIPAGLTNGTRYCYFIRARNDVGESPPSSTVCAIAGLELSYLKTMSWPESYGMIESETDLRRVHWPDRCLLLKSRLAVIRVLRKLFASHPHFKDIDELGRQQIAGVHKGMVDDIDFGWFGNMGGAGRFRGAISRNDPNLSLALDCIPATGVITQKDYLNYINHFLKALPIGGKIGTATRLLAMKRPDTFVCIAEANREGLCRAFGISPITPSTPNWADKYWHSIIEQIMTSTWWKSPAPGDGVEREVWEARAAFLDSLFYDYSGLELKTVVNARQEREEWRRFGARQLARAYGPDEPEYTEADLKPELNP